MATVYDFNLKDKKGNEVSLKTYKGKVLLIVNTATGCGFTPQYEELEAMYRSLKEKGGTDFPQFKKSDVNGANELPLYTWLKNEKGYAGGAYEEKLAAIMEDLYNKANTEPRKQNDIQWNFTKFLVNRNGEVIARFEPTVDLKEVQKAVEAAL